ncbi:MAG TPA: HEPN domain-containing protein [Kofleriaceae bacterium]|nr:HEPN domain-containing protein [Kofleriaceae bacterium]
MSAELLIANLLRVAKEDLAGARLLARSGNRNAIYLCEQAAEKVIRAVLTSEAQHAGNKHDLDEMVDHIPDENPLKASLKEIEPLAAFATSYRYPTSSGRIKPAPRPEDFDAFAQKVESVLTAAAKRFDVDLDRREAPAGTAQPIR